MGLGYTHKGLDMKVKIIVGNEAAYACANGDGWSMDVRLPAGKSAEAGLLDVAEQTLAEARALIKRAKRMAEMAAVIGGVE